MNQAKSKKKIGRNEPCWCGSGVKYKKCHLNRENQEPVKPWKAQADLKKAFSAKYCIVPKELKNKCNSKIIKAHTVSKSQNLKKIAIDSHVYAFIPSFENLTKNNGKLKPELVGINKASTFSGFCKYHDKNLFSPLEDKPFENTKEQCFLLAYRAQAREVFLKISHSKSTDLLKNSDKGTDSLTQEVIQRIAANSKSGTEAGKRDSQYHLDQMNSILLSCDFRNVKTYTIYFKKTPSIMCSTGIFPECDFNGEKLIDLADLTLTPDLLTASIIATESGGAVVFCWIDNENSKKHCEAFINSLRAIPKDQITNRLILFFFEFTENIYLNPLWWNSLDEEIKNELIDRVINTDLWLYGHNQNCLCNTSTHFDDWEFIEEVS
ncbi:MAG: hypothetical protein GY714_12340 [Desulfobacterales bacterium]|nr:hypothetical protein [Desulfobacterales bacterium]